jgi:creatinine amidohydrolase
MARGAVAADLEGGAVAAMALGALEQHGDHLPTDTDTFLAQRLLQEAADRSATQVVLLPPLPFGFSSYHARFGATISLRAETLLAVLRDVAASVRGAGARRFLVVNGHGGNAAPLRIVGHELSDEQFSFLAISYWDLAVDAARSIFEEDNGHFGHAGQLETSLLLALRPTDVQLPALAHEPVQPGPRPPTVDQLGESGVIGDPSSADASIGEQFRAAVVAALATYLDSLVEETLPVR